MADTAQEIVVATEAPPPALAASPMELLSRALERGADLAMVEKLMDLAERQEKNEARRAFNEALAAAKAEIPTIKKNRRVGFESRREGGARTDYSHEDMAEIAKVVAPILSRHGLSYRFRTHYEPGHPVTVTCIISHKLGYSEENTLPAPPDNSGNKNSIQAIGSTVTYLQRYTLKAALGLAAENDDDGKAADSAEPISAEQLQEIRDKLAASGSDIERFCKYMNVEALPDIRKNDYPKALAAIAQAMKAKKAKGKPEAPQ
jgi:hypothetical protein